MVRQRWKNSKGEEVPLEDTHVIALIAYMQRIGTDLFATEETEVTEEVTEEEGTGEVTEEVSEEVTEEVTDGPQPDGEVNPDATITPGSEGQPDGTTGAKAAPKESKTETAPDGEQ